MHIGCNRPLFCLCAAWMLGISFGWALTGGNGRSMLRAGFLCVGLAGCILLVSLLTARLRRTRVRHAVFAGLLVASAGLSLIRGGTYFSRQITPSSFPGLPPEAVAADEEESSQADLPDMPDSPVWEISAVVSERLSGGSQITGYGLILRTVQGESVWNTLHPPRAYLLCSYAADLQPGYEITLRAQAVSLDSAAGEMAAALYGDGYNLGFLSDDAADCTVTTQQTTLLSVRLGNLRRILAARLEVALGSSGQGLPSALLLGDRTYLAPSLQRDFARAGVSHLLAVSGLHLTLLFGMLAGLLRLLGIPRRGQAILLSGSVVLYLFVLGFPPAATRAAVMLSMVYLSWLCAASADALTSLGVAGMLLLGLSPATVADAGFWMSFSATLGLVTVPTYQSTRKSHAREHALRIASKSVTTVPSGLLTGLIAMTFSLWITALSVGRVSLWSPLTTLILTPLCGFLLIISLLALPLAGQWIGGAVLLPALRTVSGWMSHIAAAFSKFDWAVLSLRQPWTGTALRAVIFAMTLYLILWLFLPLSRKARLPALLPVLAGWGTSIALILLPAQVHPCEVLTSYIHPTASSEAIVLVRGREAMICDLTDGSRTAMNAALDEAEALGATELSALMLTHYHTRTAGTLWRVFATQTVHALWLPRPAEPEDYYRMLSCLHEAERAGVPVFLYEPGTAMTAFASDKAGITLTLYTDRLERSAQSVLLLHIAGANGSLTFCGGASFESALADTARELIRNSTYVIYGTHGPKSKVAYSFISSEHTRLVCFADEQAIAWLSPDSLPENPPRIQQGNARMILHCGGFTENFDIPLVRQGKMWYTILDRHDIDEMPRYLF